MGWSVAVSVRGFLRACPRLYPLFVPAAITWCCLGQGGLACAGAHRFAVLIVFAPLCGARVNTFRCITVTHYKVTVSSTACYMIINTFSFHFESHISSILSLSLSISRFLASPHCPSAALLAHCSDFSFNQLTGTMPKNLENCRGMNYL